MSRRRRTTPAGDCFNGYLAASLAMSIDMADALAIAVEAASISVTRHGASASIPYRAELTETAR